jgi:hypothetical protein
LLPEEDVAVLGKGFKRLFPLPNDAALDDLLAKLDRCIPSVSPSIKPRR